MLWINRENGDTVVTRNQTSFMDLLPSQTSKPNSKGYLLTKTYKSFKKPIKPPSTPHFPGVFPDGKQTHSSHIYLLHAMARVDLLSGEMGKMPTTRTFDFSLWRHLSMELSINWEHKVPDGVGLSQSLYTWATCICIINRTWKCQHHMTTLLTKTGMAITFYLQCNSTWWVVDVWGAC